MAKWTLIIGGVIASVGILVATLHGLSSVLKGKGFGEGFKGFFKDIKKVIVGAKEDLKKESIFGDISAQAKKATEDANNEFKNLLKESPLQVDIAANVKGKEDKVDKKSKENLGDLSFKEFEKLLKGKTVPERLKLREQRARQQTDKEFAARGIVNDGGKAFREEDKADKLKKAQEEGKIGPMVSKEAMRNLKEIATMLENAAKIEKLSVKTRVQRAILDRKGFGDRRLGDIPDIIQGFKDAMRESMEQAKTARVGTITNDTVGLLGGKSSGVVFPKDGAITEDIVDGKIAEESTKQDERLASRTEKEITAIDSSKTSLIEGLDKVENATVNAITSFQQAAMTKLGEMEKRMSRLEVQQAKASRDRISTPKPSTI